MSAPRERLRDAIAGERRDWHAVEVRPDDLAAVLDRPPDGWAWQCAGCHRPVPPMGMCETCGVFGIMRTIESARAHTLDLDSPETVERLARALLRVAYPSHDPATDDPPVMEVGDLSDSGTETAHGLAAAIIAALRET